MNTAKNTILRRIRAKKRGWVFTPKDFIDIAPRSTVDVTLHRLLQAGIIRKLDRGIYDFPIIHPKLGALSPAPDLIAKALAKKTGGVVQASGARAANQLGIDTQVSAKPTYTTSRSSVKKNIANYPINLQHSQYVNQDKLGPNVVNTIHALRHLGKNNITPSIITQLRQVLSQKDKTQLKRNITRFPDWLAPILLELTRK